MFFVDREFSFPPELSLVLLKSLGLSPEPSERELATLAQRLRELWPKLAKEHGQAKEQHYSGGRGLTEAYAAYYLAANALKLPLILEECRLLGVPLPQTGLCLDIGAGPGTTMAGLAWWQKHRSNSWKLLQLEQSKHFAEFAQKLWSNLKTSWGQVPAAEWITESATQLVAQVKRSQPNVLCFSNSLGELAPSLQDKERLFMPVIKALAEKQAPTWIIVIEPGGQDSSRELLEWRATLAANPDVKIWLPCLSNRACGALANAQDWCHEEASCAFPEWHEHLGAQAGLKKQALIFSYLVLSVGPGEGTKNSGKENAFRMVSQRLQQKGQVQCLFCSAAQGKLKLRVQHSKANAETETFFAIKRGDILTKLEWREKGDVDALAIAKAPHLCEQLFPNSPI